MGGRALPFLPPSLPPPAGALGEARGHLLGHASSGDGPRHLVPLAPTDIGSKRTRRLRLNRSSLLLHFRLLVGKKKEQEDIIAGCFDANFELLFKTRQDDEQPPPVG